MIYYILGTFLRCAEKISRKSIKKTQLLFGRAVWIPAEYPRVRAVL